MTIMLFLINVLIATLAGTVALYIISMIMGDTKLTRKGALIVSSILSVFRGVVTFVASQLGEGGSIAVQILGVMVWMSIFVVKGGFSGTSAFFAAIIYGLLAVIIQIVITAGVYPLFT